MEKRILFLEDDVEYRAVRAETLEDAGYKVSAASSVEEAEAILSQDWTHLILVDKRLVDDSDLTDRTGLDFANRNDYASIPKIMLTNYPEWEEVRAMLEPSRPDGSGAVVKFLDKDEENDRLLDAITYAFESCMDMNWHLQINWEVSKFSVGTLIKTRDGHFLLDALVEIEDLLRRLFRPYKSLIIERLVVEEDEALTLAVYAKNDIGVEREYLLQIGWRKHLRSVKSSEQFVPVNSRTTLVYTAETWRFAAVAYRLDGAALGNVRLLSDVLRTNSSTQNRDLFGKLLQRTVHPWYTRSVQTEPVPLMRSVWTEDTIKNTVVELARQSQRVGMREIRFDDSRFQIGGIEIEWDNFFKILHSLPKIAEEQLYDNDAKRIIIDEFGDVADVNTLHYKSYTLLHVLTETIGFVRVG